MTSRLANGGMAVMPKLSRRQDTGMDHQGAGTAADAARAGDGRDRDHELGIEPIGVSAANLKVVTDAMSDVVNGARGTARKYKLDKSLNAKMAGKTGTAQVRRITKAERKAGGKLGKDTPWRERDHALFTAFAPVGAPRYATAVVVEHGGSGTYAAKLTKDIMTEVLRRDPLGRAAMDLSSGTGKKGRET